MSLVYKYVPLTGFPVPSLFIYPTMLHMPPLIGYQLRFGSPLSFDVRPGLRPDVLFQLATPPLLLGELVHRVVAVQDPNIPEHGVEDRRSRHEGDDRPLLVLPETVRACLRVRPRLLFAGRAGAGPWRRWRQRRRQSRHPATASSLGGQLPRGQERVGLASRRDRSDGSTRGEKWPERVHGGVVSQQGDRASALTGGCKTRRTAGPAAGRKLEGGARAGRIAAK